MEKPAEEEFIRLLKFGTARKVRDWINSNLNMDLHYPMKDLSTPLTVAVDRSDLVLFNLLVDKVQTNLDATLTRPCGETILMYAAANAKNPEILQVLIRKGADLNVCDMNGWNCLFYAVIGKRLQNINTLLDCEISIESTDKEGRTPLMISVYLSNFEVFTHLIKSGANINTLDNNGFNALHVSILRRKRDCVIELVKNGATRDALAPFSGITIQQLMEELMYDILPVHKNTYDDDSN